MTISSVDVSAGPYVGNGIADTFEYDFKIFAEDQLRVVQTDPDGARSVLTLNADYTVTGVGSDAGGDVVLTSPLAAGFTLFVRADIDATQETDFESQGGFYPDVHEDAIDKLTLLVQQLNLRVDRVVRLDPDAENGNFQFDESVIDRRNKVLRFDNNGDIELVEFGSIEGLQGFKVETVAVTAGTTDVTVPFAYLPNTKTIWVVANGSFVPRSAYTEEPIKIVFQNPLAAGEVTFFGVSTSPVGTADAANISYGGSGNVEDALDSSLQTVATLAELPAAADNSGRVRYVKGVGVVKSDGTNWVPDNHTVVPQMFGDCSVAGDTTRQAILDAIAFADTNRRRLLIPAQLYDIGTGGLIYSATAIDDFEIVFEAGVEIVNTYSGASYPFIFNLNGVGSSVKIIGNGAELRYSNPPASRGTNHAMYLFGDTATMVDIEVRGFRIYDPANFGLAIYAGPLGGVSTGNKNVLVRDIEIYRPQGDGVHVENFDSGVDIDDIYIEEPGDDSVAVSNFIGTSGAPTKSTPTNDVSITNIRSGEAYSAAVRLLGVNRCTIDGITGTLGNVFGGIGAVAVSCDASGALADYGVPNSNITIDGVETSGGGGFFYYNDGGTLTNVKGKGICVGVNRYGIRCSQSAYAVGSKVANIDFDVNIQWDTNPGVSGGFAVETIKARDVKLTLRIDNAPQPVNIDGTDRCNLALLEAKSCGGAGTTGANIVNNTNVTLGRIAYDGSCTLATGVTATGNTNVWHTTLWDLTGATAKLSASGNTGVRGACQRVESSDFIGSVTGGTNQAVTYSEAMFTGASHQLQASLISDEGLRWGVTGLSSTGFFALWTDTMSNVRINYVAETNVGY